MYWTIMIITGVLLLGYCLLILIYRQWFLRLPVFTPLASTKPSIRFSVIIPARNEEHNITQCLRSVLAQDHPTDLYEVIVVNDHSTDKTESIVRGFQKQHGNVKLINLQEHLDGKELNAYKKKAIELAVAESHGSWIVTTDADCIVGSKWLSTLDQFIGQGDPVFVAAPVMFHYGGTFLSLFQVLDFISLQGITAAAVSAGYHTMCNGANIAYRKDVFIEVEQFKGIDNIASGDDMLLMHKINVAYPRRTGYLFAKESIVLTEPMYSWKSFINQRIRWASKADKYNDKSIFLTLALVYAVNAGLLILFFIGIFTENGLGNWLLLILAKTVVELSFMIPVARFYGQVPSLLWFPIMQPLHITYTVIAGWLGKFGSYRWKGREVR